MSDPFHPSSSQTVVVPEPFREVFDEARESVRRYFTKFVADPATGKIEIGEDRYVLVRASTLSTDFLDTIVQLYDDRPPSEALAIGRASLFDIAHTIGKNDARSFHAKMGLTDPMERLATGPVQFAFCGWALVELKDDSVPDPGDAFVLNYDHPYSFEADSWIQAGRESDFPVCIMSAGYSSGWCEESFGLALTAVEISCRARGDDTCTFMMAPPDRIRAHLDARQPAASADIMIPSYFARKREEDALRRSEQRLGSILAATPVPVLIANDAGRILFSNAHAQETFKIDEGIPTDLCGLELFADATEIDKLLARARRGEKITGEKHAMRDADGKRLSVLVSCRSLLLPDGETGVVLTTIDVTDYNRAEAALRANERMATVGALAAGVAHEVNNPLAFAIANLEHATKLIEDSGGDCDGLQGAISSALDGAERVRDIVRDLQSLSRDDGTNTTEAIDLEEVLEGAIGIAEVSWRHHARLVRDFSGDTIAQGNRARLGQVFINLIINAAQSIEEGSKARNEICVSTRPEGADRVAVTIEDTGKGMTEAELAKAFDPFFTTKPVGEGTGLGLAIAKSIVENLDGVITIKSEEGVGSAVTVSLPRGEVQRPQPGDSTHPFNVDSSRLDVDVKLEGVRLLVVDDETQLTEILAEMLSDADVSVASSGRRAKELLRHQRFDVILCDLMMPDTTGVELFRNASPEQRERMIFMTGGAFTETAARFVAALDTPCLEKPIDLAELRLAIAAKVRALGKPSP